MNHNHTPKETSFWRSRSGWVFLAFVAIAAFFLLSEHRAHTLGALPFILLALCPLLHIFGHGGHGGHGSDDKRTADAKRGGGHEH